MNERWIRWKNHGNIFWIKSKTHSCLIGDSSKDEKAKGTKKCAIKGKLKFENYNYCLDYNSIKTQIKNEISYLEKKINIDSLKKIIKNS